VSIRSYSRDFHENGIWISHMGGACLERQEIFFPTLDAHGQH
jgi:hypothetical protein